MALVTGCRESLRRVRRVSSVRIIGLVTRVAIYRGICNRTDVAGLARNVEMRARELEWKRRVNECRCGKRQRDRVTVLACLRQAGCDVVDGCGGVGVIAAVARVTGGRWRRRIAVRMALCALQIGMLAGKWETSARMIKCCISPACCIMALGTGM